MDNTQQINEATVREPKETKQSLMVYYRGSLRQRVYQVGVDGDFD